VAAKHAKKRRVAMAFKLPYRQNHYMGEHANDAAALTFIQANDWDTNKDGSGTPEQGMVYYNTTTNRLYWYSSALAAWAVIPRDHDELQGNSDDDHGQYALLAGRSGGQVLIGGTGAGENLQLESTSNGSKGQIDVVDELDMNTNQIKALVDGDPGSQDAATVAQLENAVAAVEGGLGWMTPAKALAVRTGLPSYTRTVDVLTADANGAFPSQDGVAILLDDRVLVATLVGGAGVEDHIDHGVYTLTQVGDGSNPWKLTRVPEMDNGDASHSRVISIDQGASYGEKNYRVVTDEGSDVINTDAIEWDNFGTTIDHGNQLGLGDDDHTQYHNNTRGDARYYQQSELNSTTPASEGASLVGTDSKTNLGAATTVEAALTFLNDQDPQKFSSGAGNPNSGGGTAGAIGDRFFDTSGTFMYTNITGTTTGWVVTG
jgi:hypothetical protein